MTNLMPVVALLKHYVKVIQVSIDEAEKSQADVLDPAIRKLK